MAICRHSVHGILLLSDMDVVSAAPSVAGILSIIGQNIDGIIKLINFFSNVTTASRTIVIFLRDIKSLLLALNDVEDLFSHISLSVLSRKCATNVASLQVELEDCYRDVCQWFKAASSLRPSASTNAKAWFKKLWISVRQDSVKDIRSEIGRHRQAILLNLALLRGTFVSSAGIDYCAYHYRSMSLEASSNMARLTGCFCTSESMVYIVLAI